MSLLPGEKPQYAETHFKFRLPWSLLYRPWPEIIVDAPFQFIPGAEPTLWIVVPEQGDKWQDVDPKPCDLSLIRLKELERTLFA